MTLSIEEILSARDISKVLPEKIEIADGQIVLERHSVSARNYDRWIKFNREDLYEMGWPINSGTFRVKDPASPVAVVCPAQNSLL